MRLVFKTTCIDTEKPLREGAFSFTRRTLFPSQDKRNICDKAQGLRVTSERCIGELDARCLSTLNGGQDSTATVSYGYGQHLSEKTKKPPRRRSAGRPYNAIARPQEPWAQEGGRYYTNLTYSIQEVNPEESDGSRLRMTSPAKGRSRHRRPKRGIRLGA